MHVDIGENTFDYPSDDLRELRDCNDLLDDPAALRQRMDEDGYLLVRQLIDRGAVMAARKAMLEFIGAESSAAFKAGTGARMMGNRTITHAPPVRRMVEGEELFGFFERYFGEPARTFDYKWLRAVAPTGHTGAHYDVVYMGRGSQRLHTTWIPVGDITPDLGSLAVCVGSHNEPGFEKLRNTYGKMDVDAANGVPQGWFSSNAKEITEKFGGQWATSSFRAGDVMIFPMHTMHMGTTNLTDRWRLSCDVRFQPASDPVDERWVGENPISHNARTEGDPITIEQARAKWGV